MVDPDTYFEIKDTGDFIRLEPIGLSHPNANDEWDAKWIDSRISVKAGAFAGIYKGSLRLEGLHELKKELSKLYKHLDGSTIFATLEGHLELKIKGDGNGHFEVQVKATDKPGVYQNQLMYSLEIDQTFIPELKRQLEAILSIFSE